MWNNNKINTLVQIISFVSLTDPIEQSTFEINHAISRLGNGNWRLDYQISWEPPIQEGKYASDEHFIIWKSTPYDSIHDVN